MPKKRPLLTTVLLAGTLAAPWATAGPRPAPPTTLSQAEQVCQSYGIYAWNRAKDRDNGYPLLTVTDLSRRYDRQQRSGATIENAHDEIVKAVWAFPQLSPLDIRQLTERFCLEKAGPQTTTQPEGKARLRY